MRKCQVADACLRNVCFYNTGIWQVYEEPLSRVISQKRYIKASKLTLCGDGLKPEIYYIPILWIRKLLVGAFAWRGDQENCEKPFWTLFVIYTTYNRQQKRRYGRWRRSPGAPTLICYEKKVSKVYVCVLLYLWNTLIWHVARPSRGDHSWNGLTDKQAIPHTCALQLSPRPPVYSPLTHQIENRE